MSLSVTRYSGAFVPGSSCPSRSQPRRYLVGSPPVHVPLVHRTTEPDPTSPRISGRWRTKGGEFGPAIGNSSLVAGAEVAASLLAITWQVSSAAMSFAVTV